MQWTASTRRLVVTAVLAALSAVAMLSIQFPILPGAPFLLYDPSDAVLLVAGMVGGAPWGIAGVLVKDLLFMAVRGGNPLGTVADFLAASTFVGVAAWAYGTRWNRRARSLLVPIALATLCRVLVMVVVNFPILYLEFGMEPRRVAALLWPAIVPFNALKGLINGAVGALLVAEVERRGLARVGAGRAARSA